MESNGAPLPVPSVGSVAVSVPRALRPAPRQCPPPPLPPQQRCKPSAGRRLQRSASDMAATAAGSRRNGLDKGPEETLTASLGRKPLRRIPTPPSQDSPPPALPPRRQFSRPGPGTAVPAFQANATTTSSTTTPSPADLGPATQTVLQSTTQTPSFQTSSAIAAPTSVVFAGQPLPRTQIPAASPPATPVAPPRPPPREMVSIDSPYRHRAKPNEYVDSPNLVEQRTFAPALVASIVSSSAKKCKVPPPPVARSSSQENIENSTRDWKRRQNRNAASVEGVLHHHHRANHHHSRHHRRPMSPNATTTPISTQPVSLKKPETSTPSSDTPSASSPAASASDSSSSSSTAPPPATLLSSSSRTPLPGGRGAADPFNPQPADSVYCPTCHRCTCEKCVSPRNLPSDWICKKSCYCSPETVLDYVSCMWCIKGYFYHCAKDADEDASCADDPCSCGPPRCVSRWMCMGLVATFLPCVLCYLPLKGCIGVAEVLYNCCHRRGCRCVRARSDATSRAPSRSVPGAPDAVSRSATSSSSFGRRGSLPPSLSASSTTAILGGSSSASRAHPVSAKSVSPDLRGKFLADEDDAPHF